MQNRCSQLQKLPPEIIAKHVLSFLTLREVLHVQNVCLGFTQAVRYAYWARKLVTDSNDWSCNYTRRWILHVLPHVRSLVTYGSIAVSSEMLQDMEEYQQRSILLFQSLKEMQDAGNLLQIVLSERVQEKRTSFPILKRLVITLENLRNPTPLGRLISKEKMPLLKELDIPWGCPWFLDSKCPIVVDTLRVPRAWSLHTTSRQLQNSLPLGSSIRELWVTHGVTTTLHEDVLSLSEQLNPTLKVWLYNLHIDLPAPTPLLKLLNSYKTVEFETCSISMHTGASLEIPLTFSKLRRLEFQDLDPEKHSTILSNLRFSQPPKLIFLRGGTHMKKDQSSLARLFYQHPDFRKGFRIAFDVYDSKHKAKLHVEWSKHCPSALIT